MTNLTDMFSKFVNSNTASTSSSGILPSNTITNPKVDLKGITTRSGVAYQGPTIPTTSSPPKVVERETEVIKDTVVPTNNGSTKDVQPPSCIIDVYDVEITLCVGREAITFNLDQTSRYTAYYNHMTANRIDAIDMACEEYSQEVLGFSNAPILIAPDWDLPLRISGGLHEIGVRGAGRVNSRLSTAYIPRTSGQVEVSNRGLKEVLDHGQWREKTVPLGRNKLGLTLSGPSIQLTKHPSGVLRTSCVIWIGMSSTD
ncbi:hypothetical protein Tco_1247486 [Tanacetum coccineum]